MVGKITALEVQKRNKERVNVHIDGEFAFALSLMEAAKLRKGQELQEDEIALMRDDDRIVQAVEHAARFIGYRPRSVQEIRRNLTEKKLEEVVIDAAIERLRTMGYVDDMAFARYWVENRETFKPLSPAALRQELQQKGIARDVIQEVLAEVDAEDAAYRAAEKQVRRLRTTNLRDFKHKMATFLQRRGFSYAVARSVTNRLIEALEEQTPDYFVEESDQELPLDEES